MKTERGMGEKRKGGREEARERVERERMEVEEGGGRWR